MIVYTQGRYEASLLEFRASPGQWAGDVPLVILVDGKTASASEVFAGALQDHGRALIMGEKTFGKGSIQSVFKLRNGSMLKLTTAHYFTPSGRTIHNNGIEPDIEVTREDDEPRNPGNRSEISALPIRDIVRPTVKGDGGIKNNPLALIYDSVTMRRRLTGADHSK